MKPVKLAVVGKPVPVPLAEELELGSRMVLGDTAKKLIRMVPKTTMTIRKMRKVALA